MISLRPFQVYICEKKSSDLYHLLQVMSQLEKTMTHHKNLVILLLNSIIDLSNLSNEDHPNQSQKYNSEWTFVEQTSLRTLKMISFGP